MKRIGMGAMVLVLAVAPLNATGQARRAGASKTTLARAIEIALLEVPGEALQAKIELERGKAVIEVTVFAEGKIFEVEIDGETGRVLEVEAEDGEDDDGPNGARGPRSSP